MGLLSPRLKGIEVVPGGDVLAREVVLDTHLLSHALLLGNLDQALRNQLELVGVGRPELFFFRPNHDRGQGQRAVGILHAQAREICPFLLVLG